jgi:hypothetical protein
MPFGKINKQNGKPRHPLSIIREKENLGQVELSIIIGTSVDTISRVKDDAGNNFYSVNTVLAL